MTIRNARFEEAAALAEIERLCWPSGMAADEDAFRGRLEVYPAGQYVAEVDGRLVGVVTAQRITSAFLDAEPLCYDRLTDGGRFRESHDPEGDVFQLISVSVAPAGRGMRLGRALIDHEIRFARSLPGVRRILGFTRPIGLKSRPDTPIEEYVTLRKPDGRWVDPVLDFHLSAGAQLISIHKDYRPVDREALGYGVLIEYAACETRPEP